MSTLQLDTGGGTNPRFTPFSSSASAHPSGGGSITTSEEVAIDYSKSSTNRMSPDEGQTASCRVPTKGMRKSYPEDQLVSSSPVHITPQTQPQQQSQPPSNHPYIQNQNHLNNSSTPGTVTNPSFQKVMDQQHHQPNQSSPYYQQQPQQHPTYQMHENDTPSPYYPSPPPPTYNSGNDHHSIPPHYQHPQHHHHQQQIQQAPHSRFNFNVYPDVTEEVREYQCLKCGLIFSCESDLHMHYTHDHGYGQQSMGGGGGERSSTSSTSSSGGGGHPHQINNRYHHQHNSSTGSSRASATSSNQEMFCDKCQLRFHCLLSFRVHQHEHVLPNVQPHYPMSNSHLLSLSYSCEICGANFMSRESLTDHANAHLFEHVCSEATCGGEISDQSTATNSSEDFYNNQHQREQIYHHLQNQSRQNNSNQALHYQRNCYNQQELENGERNPTTPPHHRYLPHQQSCAEDELEDSRLVAQSQGPNMLYSTHQPEYSTANHHQYPTTPQQDQQHPHHQQDYDNRRHEISSPISNAKLPGGGGPMYEPLIVMDNGKRRFQCVICKKYLSSRIAHEEHTRGKHTGDKPYSCSYCGKRFAVWNTYKHHMGTHKGGLASPPLQKCTMCEKRFKTVECLRNHMQREHNVSNGGGTVEGEENGSNNGSSGGYSCQICGKTFVRKMWRTRHYLSHAGQNCFLLPDEQSYRMHHESHKVSN